MVDFFSYAWNSLIVYDFSGKSSPKMEHDFTGSYIVFDKPYQKPQIHIEIPQKMCSDVSFSK